MPDPQNVPYKIGPGERENQLRWQGGTCWICHRDTPLVVDHDHSTGAKRGLLCQSCNVRAGWVDRNLDVINERGLSRAGGSQSFVTRSIVNYVRAGGVWDVRLLDSDASPAGPRPGSMSTRAGNRASIRFRD